MRNNLRIGLIALLALLALSALDAKPGQGAQGFRFERIGSYHTLGLVTGVAVDGRLALVGAGPSGAYLLDVSDPWQPMLLARDEHVGFAGAAAAQDRLAVLASGSRLLPDGPNQLEVLGGITRRQHERQRDGREPAR